MNDDYNRRKFVGDYMFKFKMIQERTTLLMNQAREAGKEYRTPSGKIPFIAYVEGVNQNSNFSLEDNEACDIDPYLLHKDY